MSFYVWWSTDRYDPRSLDVFDTEAEVLALLNKYATNTDFAFTVVEGREVKFKPVTVVQAYQRES